jgi:hypothetical protein
MSRGALHRHKLGEHLPIYTPRKRVRAPSTRESLFE